MLCTAPWQTSKGKWQKRYFEISSRYLTYYHDLKERVCNQSTNQPTNQPSLHTDARVGYGGTGHACVTTLANPPRAQGNQTLAISFRTRAQGNQNVSDIVSHTRPREPNVTEIKQAPMCATCTPARHTHARAHTQSIKRAQSSEVSKFRCAYCTYLQEKVSAGKGKVRAAVDLRTITEVTVASPDVPKDVAGSPTGKTTVLLQATCLSLVRIVPTLLFVFFSKKGAGFCGEWRVWVRKCGLCLHSTIRFTM